MRADRREASASRGVILKMSQNSHNPSTQLAEGIVVILFIAEVIVIQNMYLGKLVTSNIYIHLMLLKVYRDNTV